MNTVKKLLNQLLIGLKIYGEKKKGRFLKVFLSIIIFIVFVLLISGYGYRNLRVYSIYYAQNISHKSGTDPVMCAVIFNLSSVYLPHAD